MISSAHWSSPGKCLLVILALQPVGVFVPVVSQALDINCLELLTIVVALKLWGHLWRGLRLAVRCENFVAVTALNSGSCRNTFVYSCLREIVTWPLVSSLNCARFYLPDVSNSYADVLSRWCTSPANEQFLLRVQRDNLS